MLKRIERRINTWLKNAYSSYDVWSKREHHDQWLQFYCKVRGTKTEILRILYNTDEHSTAWIDFLRYNNGRLTSSGTCTVSLGASADVVVKHATAEGIRLLTEILPLTQADPAMGPMTEARDLLQELANQHGWGISYQRNQSPDSARKESPFEAYLRTIARSDLMGVIAATHGTQIVGSWEVQSPTPGITLQLRLSVSIYQEDWKDVVKQYIAQVVAACADEGTGTSEPTETVPE